MGAKARRGAGMGKPVADKARPWPSPGASPRGSGEHNAFVCDLACARSPSRAQPQNTNPSKGLAPPPLPPAMLMGQASSPEPWERPAR